MKAEGEKHRRRVAQEKKGKQEMERLGFMWTKTGDARKIRDSDLMSWDARGRRIFPKLAPSGILPQEVNLVEASNKLGSAEMKQEDLMTLVDPKTGEKRSRLPPYLMKKLGLEVNSDGMIVQVADPSLNAPLLLTSLERETALRLRQLKEEEKAMDAAFASEGIISPSSKKSRPSMQDLTHHVGSTGMPQQHRLLLSGLQ
eukprot:GSA25T00021847001.1